MSSDAGVVYLVGAGPGDPELITVRGRHLLQSADVVVHDRLIGALLLDAAKSCAEIIDVGKRPGDHRCSQSQINDLIIERARRGNVVVRLKGGDPFVYGRGWEEVQACRRAGITCFVVPGVSSVLAAPAAADIPVTTRHVGRAFAVVTGHTVAGDDPALDFAALAKLDSVIVLMGRTNLDVITTRMIAAGRSPETPATCVSDATLESQQVVRASLSDIPRRADDAGIRAPMVLVVGTVAGLTNEDSDHRPLSGRRVVITRPATHAHGLRNELLARGAVPISCPLIKVTPRDDTASLAAALSNDQEWAVFTSVNGVRGFRHQLSKLNLDARALAGRRVAAIGPHTASALSEFGITADLTADEHTAAGLLQALRTELTSGSRVLYPQSNIARPQLAAGLCELGARVDEVVVYTTESVEPAKSIRAEIEAGVDAVLFYSPSAVSSWAAAGLEAGSAKVVCIGPTTAQAARDDELTVHGIAETHTDSGLLETLSDLFESVNAAAC